MKLIEITGVFQMDTGSPSPIILSTEGDMLILFLTQKDQRNVPSIRGKTEYETNVSMMKFTNCLKYTFGSPSNETLHGHPYYQLGLESYAFYEMKDSDMIKELQTIDKIHAYYNFEKWKYYKHYIITFHDNMFECVSTNYEFQEKSALIYNQAENLIGEISAKSTNE